MKTFKISMLLSILYFCYQPCMAGDPEWLKELKAPTVSISQGMTKGQAETFINYGNGFSAMHQGPDLCKQYRRKEIAGWVLFGVGAGSLAGGGYMLYTGIRNIANSVNNDIQNSEVSSVNHRDVTFVATGAALSLLGLVLTPTGLGMGISGTVRYHKYCAQGTRYNYYISPDFDKGVGIAARF